MARCSDPSPERVNQRRVDPSSFILATLILHKSHFPDEFACYADDKDESLELLELLLMESSSEDDEDSSLLLLLLLLLEPELLEESERFCCRSRCIRT